MPRHFGVYSYDQRGHGRSDGLRGYVRRFSDYLSDLDVFFQLVLRQHPGKPVFLFGHSMGGTIAAAFTARQQPDIDGLVLSAAVARPGASVTRLSILLARTLSILLPGLGISPIDASAISRDPEVVKSYTRDPLVYHGKIRARLGSELLNTIENYLPRNYSRIQVPLLIMHGSADRLSNVEGSNLIFASVGSKDKTIKIYDGYYHEILNEPGRASVLKNMADWFHAHLPRLVS